MRGDPIKSSCPRLDPGSHQNENISEEMDCRERRQVCVVRAKRTAMPGNDKEKDW
jgi:hypothetical protein